MQESNGYLNFSTFQINNKITTKITNKITTIWKFTRPHHPNRLHSNQIKLNIFFTLEKIELYTGESI